MKRVLCFGDSNTWGYNPKNGERFPEGIRWTSLLQESFKDQRVEILEEGLCGRTTVFEDAYRKGRKGIEALTKILQSKGKIDEVILMLGTNDCKSCYNNTPDRITEGVAGCLDIILQYVAPENVLLISPIWLGENVWKTEFDPEFDRESVELSKKLKKTYEKMARKRKVQFLAASDYVRPSHVDQEHLNEASHRKLAAVIYDEIKDALKEDKNKSVRLSA